MATQATVSIKIDASPRTVWELVGDLSRHGEWSPKPYEVELVSGAANMAGTRYRSVGWVPPNDAHHENNVMIIDVVPMSRFEFHATDASGTFVNTFELRPDVAGTVVTYRLVFPAMKGLSAIMVPILFPLVGKPDIKKRMQLLKERAETTPDMNARP